MARKETEDKLTPAAREMLEELTLEYREQLLLRAEESAKSVTGELREISVHDLLQSQAAGSRIELDASSRRRTLYERTLRLYGVTGLITGLIGVFTYVFLQSRGKGTFEEQLPLLVGMAGLLLGATAFALGALRRRDAISSSALVHPLRSPDSRSRFIALWIEIEHELRRAVASRAGESRAALPLSRQVESLIRDGALTEEDNFVLRELIALRNGILHEQANPTEEELRAALKSGMRIAERLRRVGAPLPGTP